MCFYNTFLFRCKCTDENENHSTGNWQRPYFLMPLNEHNHMSHVGLLLALGVCSSWCYPSAHKRPHSPAGPPTVAYTRWWPARTLHLASSASSTMAGRSDWESCQDPNHFIYTVQVEMMFKRTGTLQIQTQNSTYKDQVLWSIFSYHHDEQIHLKWESVDLHEKTIVLEEILTYWVHK